MKNYNRTQENKAQEKIHYTTVSPSMSHQYQAGSRYSHMRFIILISTEARSHAFTVA